MNLPAGFRSEYVDLPELRLHYVEAGADRPVALLHGYTDSWHSFRLVLPALAERFRCVAIDQRGHGLSGYSGDRYTLDAFAEDAIGLLGALGIERTAIVGHSMGSFVTRKIALKRPDLVERLALVDSGPRSDTLPIGAALDSHLREFGEAIPRDFIEELVISCLRNRGAAPRWFIDGCVEAGLQATPAAWRGALAALSSDNHSDELGRITQPVLVIGGAEDAAIGRQEQEELARRLPRARLVLYERTGHTPQWEHPERFAADLAAFLNESDPI